MTGGFNAETLCLLESMLTIMWFQTCRTLFEGFIVVVCVIRFVLLACDGLFKVFSADEAVQFVLNILEVCILMHFLILFASIIMENFVIGVIGCTFYTSRYDSLSP